MRPEGYVNPFKPDGENNEYYGDIGARDASVFEAGADAMLEALLKGEYATPIKAGESDTLGYEYIRGGTVIFIPEEGDEETKVTG